LSTAAEQARDLIRNWHERGWTQFLALLLGVVSVALSAPLDDFWLSIASGRELLAGADLGRALPFTHTPMVEGAINPQWGAQLLFAISDSAALAVAVQVALVASGLLLIYWRALTRTSVMGAALAMLVALAVLKPFLIPRVQALSLLFFPVALLLIERRGQGRWLPIAYGALMLIWANVHGAFVLGQGLPLAFLIGPLVNGLRARKLQSHVRENWPLLITAVIALLVPLINPVGPALYSYAYGQAANKIVLQLATEWDPAWPWTEFGAPYWAFGLLVVAGRPWRHPHRSGELFLLVATFIMGVMAVRSLPWFVLTSTALLAEQICRWLGPPGSMSRAAGNVPATGGSALAIPIVIAVAAVLLQPLRPLLPDSIGRLTPIMPVALVDELERQLPDKSSREPIFNYQGWGGYIAYRLGSRVATFVDGRIETPTIATWDTYLGLIHAKPGFIGSLAGVGIKWVIVGHNTPLQTTLESSGWRVALATPEGVLMERRADR